MLILFVPCSILGTLISLIKHEGNRYYINRAVGLDHLANVFFQYSLNFCCIKKDSVYKFGDIRESISGVLGKNKKVNKLTVFGLFLCKTLNNIQKDHVEKAIDNSI